MKYFISSFIIILLLVNLYKESYALEVYRVIQKDCSVNTGLIIDTDPLNVGLLSISGKFITISRDQINNILIYNLTDNPIQTIEKKESLSRKAYKIYVEGDSNYLFIGWAVRFVDDLVFFYDIEGKSFVLDIHKIIQIQAVDLDDLKASKIDKFKVKSFDFGRNFPECNFKIGEDPDFIQPMRMLSDQIKIEKKLADFKKGLKRLERFKQRTVFYAKAKLYDDQSQLGVYQFIGKDGSKLAKPQESHGDIPLFFQWSGGDPYLYQHQTSIGSKPSALIPRVETVMGFASDLKAHLFHGSFILNIKNPTSGEISILQNAQNDNSYFSDLSEKETFVMTEFNYTALSGVDYGKSSISIGYSYPVFGIQTGGKDGLFREVLSSEGSPTIRYRFIDDDLKLRILYSKTQFNINAPSVKDIALYPTETLLSGEMSSNGKGEQEDLNLFVKQYTKRYLDHFRFNNDFIRFGFDWDIDDEVQFGIDEVILQGTYRETIKDKEDSSSTFYYNTVDYTHFTTSSYVRHQFGDRVALSLYLNYFIRNQKSFYLNQHDTTNEAFFSIFAMFEFLL